MPAKYQLIASELADRIRRGELGHRDKLPGELELAQEFAVSRGTVRQALATLAQHGLIETWTGSGSFVSYDGARLDDEKGWSEALAQQSVPTRVELVALDRLELPAVAGRGGLPGDRDHGLRRVRQRRRVRDQPAGPAALPVVPDLRP
jgi:GntR family transcriptional regulator